MAYRTRSTRGVKQERLESLRQRLTSKYIIVTAVRSEFIPPKSGSTMEENWFQYLITFLFVLFMNSQQALSSRSSKHSRYRAISGSMITIEMVADNVQEETRA